MDLAIPTDSGDVSLHLSVTFRDFNDPSIEVAMPSGCELAPPMVSPFG
jgi:hypothetical protein